MNYSFYFHFHTVLFLDSALLTWDAHTPAEPAVVDVHGCVLQQDTKSRENQGI
jgi:hypothetical protein